MNFKWFSIDSWLGILLLCVFIPRLWFALQDVMNQVRSDTVLEMNLEKSRVKELVSEHIKSEIKLVFGQISLLLLFIFKYL